MEKHHLGLDVRWTLRPGAHPCALLIRPDPTPKFYGFTVLIYFGLPPSYPLGAMILRISSVAELSSALAKAFSAGSPVQAVDMRALNKVVEYRPEDMTVTVQTGIVLADLQKQLATHGQWLPIDPPQSERLTIDELLNRNLSGPRRFGYGTIREHLLGITAVLADGRVIHNGGKVVKNVAGFDLCKLFVGSHWSLGVVVEATFKLRPLPTRELFLAAQCRQLSDAVPLVQAVLDSQLTPVVL